MKADRQANHFIVNESTHLIDRWIGGKRYVILSLVFLLLASPALNLFIQYRTKTVSESVFNPVIINCIGFVGEHPLAFAFSSVLLFFVLVICAAIVKNAVLGTGIFAAFIVLFTFIDGLKFEARQEHLLPGDLSFAANIGALDGMYDRGDLIRQFVLVFIILLISSALTVLVFKIRRRAADRAGSSSDSSISADEKKSKIVLPFIFSRRINKYRGIVIRLLVIALSVSAIFIVTIDVRGDGIKEIPMIDYYYIGWNQEKNFERNGFVLAFVSNFKNVGMAKPKGYSKAKIKSVVEKYRNVAKKENAYRVDLKDKAIDVVFVMNESFTEPERFKDIYPYESRTGEALTPNLTELRSKAAGGHIYSPRYGGGTANVEFEGLTGMTTLFLGYAVPFQEILPKMDNFPSIASLLSDAYGYKSIGLHPYGAAMYRRSLVYPKLGFSEFHGDDEFEHVAHDAESLYISDESAYDEVRDYLEKDEDENKFITLITMQNHLRYGYQKSDHPFETTAKSGHQKLQIDDYMALLSASDRALKGLTTWIDGRKKKTMLVFWGDHLPGVYGDLLISRGNRDMSYETPFIIYSNFKNEEEALGTVSPNYISTMALDYLNAKKSPWDYLLNEVKKIEPRFTKTFLGERSVPNSDVVDDYAMIEYDIVSGKGYSRELGMFELP